MVLLSEFITQQLAVVAGRAASAYLVYSLSQSGTHYDTSKASLTSFLGKFTGTMLSLPVGKMVVITGVREQFRVVALEMIG